MGMRALTRIIAILIGAVFIYAGIVKVMEPIAFAKDIDNYKMLSWPVSVALGFFLPWLEIAAGVALVTRWMERGGLLLLTALTTVFIIASLVAKSRGLDISCGCFGSSSGAVGLGSALRAAGILLVALGGAYGELRRQSRGSPAKPIA